MRVFRAPGVVVGFGAFGGVVVGRRHEILLELTGIILAPLKELCATEVFRVGMDQGVGVFRNMGDVGKDVWLHVHEEIVGMGDVAYVGLVGLVRTRVGGGTALAGRHRTVQSTKRDVCGVPCRVVVMVVVVVQKEGV